MTRTIMAAFALASAAPILPASLAAQPLVSEAALGEKVAAARQRLAKAILANDPEARARLYRADAISMPEHQPALIGPDNIAAYHRAMRQRLTMTRYEPVPEEIFALGDGALEFGTFTAAWSTPGGVSEERRGKYAHLWKVESDANLRLKADVWGYFEPLPDPALFFVELPGNDAPAPVGPGGDPALAEALKLLNETDAEAVRTRNVEAKLGLLAEDAIIMPFADTPKSGMAEIRPYLTQYTANGAGITFDDVRVWNIGFEDHGEHVIEFSKFHVDWRFPGRVGITKGGGLHLWKRQPDGTLKRLRQIGTHDHVP